MLRLFESFRLFHENATPTTPSFHCNQQSFTKSDDQHAVLQKKKAAFLFFFSDLALFSHHFHFYFLISKHPICCHLKSVLLVPFSYLFFSMFCFASQSLSGLLCSGRPHSFILKLHKFYGGVCSFYYKKKK